LSMALRQSMPALCLTSKFSTMSDIHTPYLRECFKLCRDAIVSGNPPFASILVHDGKIIASAYNTSTTDKDFTKHGEMNLLANALRDLTPDQIKSSVLYAGNEPCPMCSGAIYWSGIRKVVYGSSRDALSKLRRFGLNVQCRDILMKGTDPFEVIGPLLEEEVMPLYQEYYFGSVKA
jgi:tRNA(Arg) A34 adenosine deaminase TadA